MRRYYELSGDTLDWAPATTAAPHLPLLTLDELQKAVHVVQPNGQSVHGAEAMFTIMDRIGLRRWPLALYRHVPPFHWACDLFYRSVANHRGIANQLSSMLFGKVELPSTFLLTRRVFLRLMGLILLAAFISIGTQLPSLFGDQELLPAAHLVQHATDDTVHWWRMADLQLLPLNLTETRMQALVLIGALGSAMMTIGFFPIWSAIMAWLAYLIIFIFGGVSFQQPWDALLLEVGLLAVLWSPGSWRLNSLEAKRPSRLVYWLILLLLGKLIFFGSLFKLQTGDSIDSDSAALTNYLWMQPLPLCTAWYADALPAVVSKLACVLMFIIGLGAPVLLLFPRVPRAIGASLIMLLMIGILATGNYGFFNWLIIVLCLTMFDDALLLKLWPQTARGTIRVGIRPPTGPLLGWIRNCLALLVLALGIISISM